MVGTSNDTSGTLLEDVVASRLVGDSTTLQDVASNIEDPSLHERNIEQDTNIMNEDHDKINSKPDPVMKLDEKPGLETEDSIEDDSGAGMYKVHNSPGGGGLSCLLGKNIKL